MLERHIKEYRTQALAKLIKGEGEAAVLRGYIQATDVILEYPEQIFAQARRAEAELEQAHGGK
jgi:hypothetical protein